ncbi:S-antigen protein isoform X3 [Drosophila obscura]|uniref:S-antigen protein isoform X3 n=1 Tax=Drosophila obscura TaxID=7282 RepID=UPI001BB2AFF2|nr:S-antigen protein isoform X3 [Drosophila obscura]
MKHLLTALVVVLSATLPGEQVLGSATGCSRRYLRRINGKCYYFSVKKMNWHGALNNCLRKGLTLADLSNPRDFYGAIDFLSSKGNTEDFWFGGNDLQHEGRFQYISNGRLVRFFSNYSIVEPAEHSECDDCLEVRIRSNMTVVADDNCLERQYFICSERYCEGTGDAAKPKHHSHEHLHHFHHDIGDSAGDDEVDANDTPPIGSGSGENAGSDSEGAVEFADLPDDLQASSPTPMQEMPSDAELPPGGQPPPWGGAEAHTEASPASEEVMQPGDMAEGRTTSSGGEDQETGAGPSTPAGEGEGTTAAEGALTTPAAGGEEKIAGEGGETKPGEGGETKPGEGGETPAGEGGVTATGEGGATPAGEGGATPAGEGGETPAGEGGATPAGEGGETPAGEGGAAPAGEGGAAPAAEGEATPAAEGEAKPAAEGEATPAAEGEAAEAPPAEGPAARAPLAAMHHII